MYCLFLSLAPFSQQKVYSPIMRKMMYLLLIVAFGFASTTGRIVALAQDPVDEAQEMLDEMSPAERIGQLFIVTMHGSEIDEDHPIQDLIANHHISGVILSMENDNFVDEPDTLQAVRSLIVSLQEAEFDSSLRATIIDPETQEATRPQFIPLFIGISQEGGGAPYSQILSGMTDLPSAMAIGATWDSELAREVGEVLGSELRALGFNLLLGPSLDVLDEPRLVGSGDLGVRTFGGDPFWVSMMGREYISGLHEGSEGRLAVIAKHFPGLGGSDRNTEVEVPTVRRSLEQLLQIELEPFAEVSGNAPGDAAVVDGLLTSHIRYQGFQGNIRAATRPVSLDSQALLTLLGLDPFDSWREGGGVVVSDSLGARSIRRFYDPSETVFKGHLVARDALIAGNDLLQLSAMESEEDPTGIGSIKATLAFFEQKYIDDPVFAERVDEAALRIIQLKLRIYGGVFSLSNLHPRIAEMSDIGSGGAATFEVARSGATLISPPQENLLEELGEPPSAGERIVLFTDVREVSQCSSCVPFEEIGMDDFASEMLDLYGPMGTGQIVERDLSSFTMADLAAYMGETPPDEIAASLASSYSVEVALEAADWIVFSVLKSSDEVYGSNALKLLLDRRPDLVRAKRVVVFAYDVPYDADATDLSKIDAYYALYSKSEAFVEIAARMLFQELPGIGSSPVNVAGIGYDLIEALAPDPGQLISLSVVSTEAEGTAEATPTGFRRGDHIHITTGVIVDSNGNPVPDGTPVVFDLAYQAEGVAPLQVTTVTTAGIASMSVTLDRLGMLSIQAMSDLARTSEVLQLDVQEDAFAFVTVIAPTPNAQATVSPTATSALVTATPDEVSGGEVDGDGEPGGTGLLDLAVGLLGMAVVSTVGFLLTRRWTGSPEQTPFRYALVGAVFALAGYDYLALGLPGSADMIRSVGAWASLAVTIGMGIVGQTLWAVVSVIWRRPKAN